MVAYEPFQRELLHQRLKPERVHGHGIFESNLIGIFLAHNPKSHLISRPSIEHFCHGYNRFANGIRATRIGEELKAAEAVGAIYGFTTGTLGSVGKYDFAQARLTGLPRRDIDGGLQQRVKLPAAQLLSARARPIP